MGFDINIMNFLVYSRQKYGSFRNVITLGRQEIHVIPPKLERLFSKEMNHESYCESILVSEFFATNVDSIDYSGFEGATILHDLNLPIDENRFGTFDTLIDAGTLEHVFDVKTALDNCSNLVNEGGRIIHVLPANNFNGHGFYQFSPELFFSYYSEENGFQDTEIFISNIYNAKFWYLVSKTADKDRHAIHSYLPLYIMVHTKKSQKKLSKEVLQSDYEYSWDNKEYVGNIIPPNRFRAFFKKYKLVHLAYDEFVRRLESLKAFLFGYKRSPHLKKINVKQLIRRTSIKS